jgi:hypothetical protein
MKKHRTKKKKKLRKGKDTEDRQDELYWTAQQTQWLHSISAPTLGEWVKRGFPKSGRNRYPVRADYNWVKVNIFHTNGIHGNIDEEKLLHERARRRRAEYEADKMAGDLVSRDEASQQVSVLAAEVKQALLAFPRRMASVLILKKDVKEIEIELDREIKHNVFVKITGPKDANKRSKKS